VVVGLGTAGTGAEGLFGDTVVVVVGAGVATTVVVVVDGASATADVVVVVDEAGAGAAGDVVVGVAAGTGTFEVVVRVRTVVEIGRAVVGDGIATVVVVIGDVVADTGVIVDQRTAPLRGKVNEVTNTARRICLVLSGEVRIRHNFATRPGELPVVGLPLLLFMNTSLKTRIKVWPTKYQLRHNSSHLVKGHLPCPIQRSTVRSVHDHGHHTRPHCCSRAHRHWGPCIFTMMVALRRATKGREAATGSTAGPTTARRHHRRGSGLTPMRARPSPARACWREGHLRELRSGLEEFEAPPV